MAVVTAPGEGVSEHVHRLAVLLSAGLSPPSAWRHLAAQPDAPEGAARVADALGAGRDGADEIARLGAGGAAGAGGGGGPGAGSGARRGVARRRGGRGGSAVLWRQVAAAWAVATAVGAPLSPALRTVADALRQGAESVDDARTAFAEPAGTARIMTWLPLASILLGAALGFDSLTVLFGQPRGWVCLAGGLALMLAASRWNARLLRAARPPEGVPGLRAEVVAVALSGGTSVPRADWHVAELELAL